MLRAIFPLMGGLMTMILSLAAAACLTVATASAVKEPPERNVPAAHLQTDKEIQDAVVKGLLANPEVSAAGIHVVVLDRVVTLTGFVRTNSAKKMADRVARAVPGVRAVRNKLVVRSPAR